MLEQEWEMPCLRLPVVKVKNNPISSCAGAGMDPKCTLLWHGAFRQLMAERGRRADTAGLGALPLPMAPPALPGPVLVLIHILRGMERGRGKCCPQLKSKEHCFHILSIVLPSWIIIILHLNLWVFLRLHKGTEARDSLLTAQMSVVLPDCVFYCMGILGYCCGNARYYISLPHEGVDALAQAARSCCGCPSPAVSQAGLDGV